MFFVCLVVLVLTESIVISTSTSVNNSSELNFGTLVLANVLFRHGDRTPVSTYPTDPYRNLSNWPVGWGQLTKIGKEQHYELGQWLRQRYKDFLPETYSRDDIYVRSTDVDRTLMSAECNMAGLYPPSNPEEWHDHLKWQPVPVHTKPETEDEILAAKKPCARYDREYDKLMHSETIKHINKVNAELYKYLTKNSGIEVKDVVAVEYLYDTLHIEELYNKSLPDWTKSVYPNKMEPIAALSFTIQAMNKQLQRLKSGPLLGELVSNMKKAANGLLDLPRKIFVYSAHDITIANLLMTLKVFDHHCPPYAATVLIELRKKLQDYYVMLSYRNLSSHEPYMLQIPGCNISCPLNDFIALTQSAIPENWEEECQLGNMINEFQLNNLAVLALSVCVILALLLFISIILSVLYWKRQKSSAYYYHQIHTEG